MYVVRDIITGLYLKAYGRTRVWVELDKARVYQTKSGAAKSLCFGSTSRNPGLLKNREVIPLIEALKGR